MLRKLARDVAVYGIGDLLVKAIAFIQTPIYTKLLFFSKAEMGLWGSAMSVVGLFTAVLALGMDSAYALQYFQAKDDEQKREATSTALLFSVALSLPAVALLSLGAVPLAAGLLDDSRHAWLLILAMWLIPLQLAHTLAGQVLRNQMRPRAFVGFNFLTVLCSVGAGVGVVSMGWARVEGVFVGTLTGVGCGGGGGSGGGGRGGGGRDCRSGMRG